MLNNRKKEFLYALTGFGPLLIMAMFMAYIPNAFDPSNLRVDIEVWAFAAFPIVIPGLFAVLFFIGRIFDGLIEVPLASVVDRMKNPLMKIRLPILISLLPMIGSAIAIGLPVAGNRPESIANTVWFMMWALVFFTSYTMNIVAFFSSLTLVCKDRKQRTRIAFYKASSDTVLYALAYAVMPMVASAINMNIMQVAIMLTPLMATSLIPVFMIKKQGLVNGLDKSGDLARAADIYEAAEQTKIANAKLDSIDTDADSKLPYREAVEMPILSVTRGTASSVVASDAALIAASESVTDNTEAQIASDMSIAADNNSAAAATDSKRPNMFKQIFRVFKNRAFWPWLLVLAVYYIGLQMFLGSQNALVSGVAQAPAWASMIVNVCAFGPVPFTLWLFGKLIKKKGIRFAFRIVLITFLFGTGTFFFGSAWLIPNNIALRVAIIAIGGLICSFGIGGMMSTILITPSQIAAVEMKVTKKNNTATYFAAQTVVMAIFTALTIFVYMEFLVGIGDLYVVRPYFDYNIVGHYTAPGGAWNPILLYENIYRVPIGGMLVPLIIAVANIGAVGLTFLMPKSYDAKTLGKYFDKNYVPDAEDEADAEIQETIAHVPVDETSTANA